MEFGYTLSSEIYCIVFQGQKDFYSYLIFIFIYLICSTLPHYRISLLSVCGNQSCTINRTAMSAFCSYMIAISLRRNQIGKSMFASVKVCLVCSLSRSGCVCETWAGYMVTWLLSVLCQLPLLPKHEVCYVAFFFLNLTCQIMQCSVLEPALTSMQHQHFFCIFNFMYNYFLHTCSFFLPNLNMRFLFLY